MRESCGHQSAAAGGQPLHVPIFQSHERRCLLDTRGAQERLQLPTQRTANSGRRADELQLRQRHWELGQQALGHARQHTRPEQCALACRDGRTLLSRERLALSLHRHDTCTAQQLVGLIQHNRLEVGAQLARLLCACTAKRSSRARLCQEAAQRVRRAHEHGRLAHAQQLRARHVLSVHAVSEPAVAVAVIAAQARATADHVQRGHGCRAGRRRRLWRPEPVYLALKLHGELCARRNHKMSARARTR